MPGLTVRHDGVTLAASLEGQGRAVVLLHGLTAVRRHVVMGSRHLERSGHRVVAHDARGHGESSPAPGPGAYRYPDLAGDLEAVMDAAGMERAVLAGASMGAHTALHLALRQPARVAALVIVTPGYDPQDAAHPERLERWDALADGLRRGGVEGFMAAYGEPPVPPRWRDTVLRATRQRMAAHRHPAAVADALGAVPRSAPFPRLEDLGGISAPSVVVASRDEADPQHPLALAHAYARAIPGARLEVEEPGRSPLAWQGGRLSRIIAQLAARA